MSVRRGHQYPHAPERGLSTDELARRVAQAVNGILAGETNNTATVTLAPNATETVIDEPRVKVGTVVLLSPQSASAAAATGLSVVAGAGTITISHDASPATDRTFGMVFFGAAAA